MLYPLRDFDLVPGAPEGALEKMVNLEHTHMLEVPRVMDLITKKWETFGKRLFWKKMIQTLVFLALFFISTIYRLDAAHYGSSLRKHISDPEKLLAIAQETFLLARSLDWQAIKACSIALCDFLVFVAACVKLKREIGELRQEGFAGYFGCKGAAFIENTCSLSFCLGVVYVAVMRLGIGTTQDEAIVLAPLSVVGWGYTLFFLMAFPSTGPLVVMMIKMLSQDVTLFITIYAIFLVGFSQAFYIQFQEDSFLEFGMRLKSCFVTMLGDIDFESYMDNEKVVHPWLSTLLITLYIVSISVMLLNLLIAMMGDTYTKIIDDSRKIWQLQQARILFSLETEMTTEERKKVLSGYKIMIKDEAYVQVYKVDPEHFGTKTEDREAALGHLGALKDG